MNIRRSKPVKEAQRLISQFNITQPPINVFKIIEDLGINYAISELTDDISGILDQRDIKRPYIIVNKDHHQNRIRFSAAHELGHYLLHSQNGMHIDKKSFYRNSKSSEGIYRIEIEANQFAAELLMPTDMILNELHAYEDFVDSNDDMIWELAKKFKVSTTAMSFKLQSILELEGYNFN